MRRVYHLIHTQVFPITQKLYVGLPGLATDVLTLLVLVVVMTRTLTPAQERHVQIQNKHVQAQGGQRN